jgi:uncharacterized sulfatase
MYDPDSLTVPGLNKSEHDNNPPHFKLTQEENPDFSSYQEKDGNACHGFFSHLQDKKSLSKDIAVYYGMISLMDKYIGKILDKLDSLGIAGETLVVFTTDHGHFFGHHGLNSKGAFHYDDLIKIPFIARLPGKIPAGKACSSLQSLVDLAPTFLDFCGINIPRTMTGKSQKEVWTGKTDSVRDNVIVENRHQPTKIFHKTCVDNRYKITIYYDNNYGELFDLQKDPGEICNLWNNPEYSQLKQELLLKYIHAEMAKEPLWMPRVCGA